MKAFVITVFTVFAVLTGLIAGLFGGIQAIQFVLVMLPFIFLFYDYRIGVVCMIMVLPISNSDLLSQIHGLNILNDLVLGTSISFVITTSSFFMRTAFSQEQWNTLPRIVVWCYLLPITVAVFVGSQHVNEITPHFLLNKSFVSTDRWDYVRSYYIRPLRFLLFAWLLANSVRDSIKPARFLVPVGIAAIAPAIAVMTVVTMLGWNLGAIQKDRDFLSGIGLHANEMGLLLSLAAGPLLFMLPKISHRGIRWLTAGILALVIAALLLTFSRGAYVGLMVTVLIFLVSRRRFMTIATFAILGALLIGFGPQAIRDRLTTGLERHAIINQIGTMDDPLTADRVAGWSMLAPEILKSPIWGNGIGSTAWSAAARAGRYSANHPHNLYLEILLDLGIAGFACIMVFYRAIAQTLRNLAKETTLPPVLQGYFSGATASFFALLVTGFANGHYLPGQEQAFLWISLGLAWGCRKQPRPVTSPASPPTNRAETVPKRGITIA